jgi:hypothetical protein
MHSSNQFSLSFGLRRHLGSQTLGGNQLSASRCFEWSLCIQSTYVTEITIRAEFLYLARSDRELPEIHCFRQFGRLGLWQG